jgi:lipopolysaccharide export system permease protein
MSEHTDDFTKAKLPAKTIFVEYYAGFVPFIVAMLFPLFVFISVIFFTSKMANRSEFIAILASGVSLKRILRPYIVGGILLGVILYFANYYVLPRANEKRTKFEAKYIKSPIQEVVTKSIYMRVDSFSYCGIRYYDTSSKTGSSFFLARVRNNQVVYNLRADNINWDTAKKTWKLSSVVERSIGELKEEVRFHQELYRNFNFKPIDLQRDEYVKSRLTTPELTRMIELEKLRGSESVKELQMEKAHRVSTILACRKIRGGSGAHLAMGIIICAVFILTDRFSTIFSVKGNLNPYVAAWVPNVVFGFITIWLYKKAPK